MAQWRSTLETYAYPFIGQKVIGEITKVDLLTILEPIWLTKNETASRLRGRIEAIIDYAKAKEYFEGDNPAAWKGMLKPSSPYQAKCKIRNTMRHYLMKKSVLLCLNCANVKESQPVRWSFLS